MLDVSAGRRRFFDRSFFVKNSGIRLLALAFVLFGFLSATGCEDVKPLTPEEKSLVSAWSVRERMEHAYSEKSVDNVLNVLSPELASIPDMRTQLTNLFGMFESVDLHLIMDSGRIDTTAHIVHFRAHWTVTGVPKGKKEGHYFQTGECRLAISLQKAPLPAQILKIEGDTFLAAPGKFSAAK